MPSLVNTQGPDKGKHYPIGTEPLVTLGRDDACTYQIRDARVSRKHLQVALDPGSGECSVADYRTANGTTLNGAHVTTKTPLKDGDEIRIGDTSLIYSSSDYADDEAAMKDIKKKGEWKRSTIM